MNQTNKTSLLMTSFFYFKICYVWKNSDLYLRKIQISFYVKKFKFASKEDANQFLF